MRQCVAVCCSVLQCVGGVLQSVAECCSVLQCLAVSCSVLQCLAVSCSVLQRVAVCCSVLQCVAVRSCVLQCVALCCSVGNHSRRRPDIKYLDLQICVVFLDTFSSDGDSVYSRQNLFEIVGTPEQTCLTRT